MKTIYVTANQFNRKPAYYQDLARKQPVIITRYGREHVVIVSVDDKRFQQKPTIKLIPKRDVWDGTP